MFIGLGTGGVGVAMFHLLTHACFKALLFLGAGSVIHGCHHEQDIRKMGGIRRFMPVTFATYTIGMLALAGFPLFAGFWSKDEILHSAHGFEPGQWPFYIGLVGAFLTAFYMTRQMFYVFVGEYRGVEHERSETKMEALAKDPHESPKVMTTPLVVLAGFALVLGLFSTPLYPWLESYLEGHHAEFSFSELVHALPFMLLSSLIVGAGLILGWWYYGLVSHQTPEDPDVLVERFPRLFAWLNGRFFVDELYALSVIRWAENFARFCDWVDRRVLSGIVYLTGLLTAGIAWLARFTDEFLVNGGFDRGCRGLKMGGGRLGGVQNGQVQSYLRVFGVTVVLIVLLLAWGGSR
jgi:NADH-quinone oxidoreductase subunit L